MNALNKLIGQKVIATIEDTEIEGTVQDVDINDFYFYEKGEPIYITVSVLPTGEIDEDFDEEDFSAIPLDNIRKA